MTKTGFVPVDGGRVFYILYGAEKTGTPLICMHGGPGGTHNGYRKMEALADERPVLIYDQLGGGFSDRNPDKKYWTVEHFVKELGQIRDYFHFDEVFLLGGSWGTMLEASYMIMAKPTGVKGCVFSAPCLQARRWEADCSKKIDTMLPDEHRNAIREAERTGNFDTPEYKEADKYFTKQFTSRLMPDRPRDPTAPKSGRDVYMYMWGPSEFNPTGTLKDFDVTEDLHTITCPSLYTCGEYDTASPEATAYYAEKTNGARCVVFPECSHAHSSEKPEEYLALVREFLHEVEGK